MQHYLKHKILNEHYFLIIFTQQAGSESIKIAVGYIHFADCLILLATQRVNERTKIYFRLRKILVFEIIADHPIIDSSNLGDFPLCQILMVMATQQQLRGVKQLLHNLFFRTTTWTAAPMTRAHFETWAAAFQPPDADEMQLFDEPTAVG